MGHSVSSAVLAGVGLPAWLIAALILAFTPQDRLKQTATGIVFSVPLTGRLATLMLAVFCTAAWPLLLAGILASGDSHQPMTAASWVMFGLLESLGTVIGLALFRVCGPNELAVNLDRRTYRYTHGWPFHPTVRTGSLDEDIAGVYVRCAQMNVTYEVGIVWKHRPGWRLLDRFNRSGQADRFAEEMAAALELPLVVPPPALKTASDVRDGRP
jgi:hypothetical protein